MKSTGISRSLSTDGRTLIVSVPIAFKQHGGSKRILTPVGAAPWSSRRAQPKSALIAALAKAHRWRRLIETGDFATTAELARSVGVNESYLCRIVRLTLLSPEIVVAILNGNQTPGVDLSRLLGPFSCEWHT